MGTDIDAEVLAAVREAGYEPRSAVLVGGWRAGRATYRITIAGGGQLKARRHQGRTRGARAADLTRALADPGFPAPVAVVGRVVLETWVRGAVVSDARVDRAVVDQAAALLGRLHRVSDLPGRRIRAERSTAPLVARTVRQLDDLGAAGIVDGRDRRRLEVLLRALPPTATRGLTHGDFCGDNLVVTRRALVCIDNEAVGMGFLDEDVARTWSRWPLPARAWTRFRIGIARATDRRVDHAADQAWCAVAAVRGAHRWSRARATAGDAPLRTLETVVTRARAT